MDPDIVGCPPVQLYLARSHGADAVLLMVSILGESVCEYLDLASTLGLDSFVEVHDEAELEIARLVEPDRPQHARRRVDRIDDRVSDVVRGERRAEGFGGFADVQILLSQPVPSRKGCNGRANDIHDATP